MSVEILWDTGAGHHYIAVNGKTCGVVKKGMEDILRRELAKDAGAETPVAAGPLEPLSAMIVRAPAKKTKKTRKKK